MDKRTITIDACDMPGSCRIAEMFFENISGEKLSLGNLDALFDSITEFGNGMCIIVKNAEHLTPDARRMLDDALANSTGLEIVFESSDGNVERRSSAPAGKATRIKRPPPGKVWKTKARALAIANVPKRPLWLKIVFWVVGLFFAFLFFLWAYWALRGVIIPRLMNYPRQ